MRTPLVYIQTVPTCDTWAKDRTALDVLETDEVRLCNRVQFLNAARQVFSRDNDFDTRFD